ncbi:MAG: hypothetical protein AB7O04_06145 [Hyphomonadaceae bacterium]
MYEHIPAGVAAKAAVAANPGLSNIAIAKKIGVSDQTIGRARKQSGPTNVGPVKRLGRDGKYQSPKKTILADVSSKTATTKQLIKAGQKAAEPEDKAKMEAALKHWRRMSSRARFWFLREVRRDIAHMIGISVSVVDRATENHERQIKIIKNT